MAKAEAIKHPAGHSNRGDEFSVWGEPCTLPWVHWRKKTGHSCEQINKIPKFDCTQSKLNVIEINSLTLVVTNTYHWFQWVYSRSMLDLAHNLEMPGFNYFNGRCVSLLPPLVIEDLLERTTDFHLQYIKHIISLISMEENISCHLAAASELFEGGRNREK